MITWHKKYCLLAVEIFMEHRYIIDKWQKYQIINIIYIHLIIYITGIYIDLDAVLCIL